MKPASPVILFLTAAALLAFSPPRTAAAVRKSKTCSPPARRDITRIAFPGLLVTKLAARCWPRSRPAAARRRLGR